MDNPEEKMSKDVPEGMAATDAYYVEVTPNGPYLVHGAPPIAQRIIEAGTMDSAPSYRMGKSFESKELVALCRCGQSKAAPFCDGSHITAGKDLQETASFDPFLDNASMVSGPQYHLADNQKYCAYARFCDSGNTVWNEAQSAVQPQKALVENPVNHCPGGRLVLLDKVTNTPIEPNITPGLYLLEDEGLGCSGPLAVWGGIRVESASGHSYEIRNRQALCRCGASKNKPFCDGSHASVNFNDGILYVNQNSGD